MGSRVLLLSLIPDAFDHVRECVRCIHNLSIRCHPALAVKGDRPLSAHLDRDYKSSGMTGTLPRPQLGQGGPSMPFFGLKDRQDRLARS